MLILKDTTSNDLVKIRAMKVFDFLIACHKAGRAKPTWGEIATGIGISGDIRWLARPLKYLEDNGFIERKSRLEWILHDEKLE